MMLQIRKVGHDAKNCRTNSQLHPTPGPSRPSQQILNMEEVPTIPTQTAKQKSSVLSDYAHILGKLEDKVLQTLKLCYKEPGEEVKIVETFSDQEDF